MAFNRGNSILGTGDTADHVAAEADVIFTATFIGTTIWYNVKYDGKPWRVDMEPERDVPKAVDRTASDRKSMKLHNDACSKVNHVVGTATKTIAGLVWGLTPMFDRGGAICAGDGAKDLYNTWDPLLAAGAFKVLTDTNVPVGTPQVGSVPRQQEHSMYIGRGAYCGLVTDTATVKSDKGLEQEIQAVVAMSTLRTTLKEGAAGVGDRWVPGEKAPVRAAQYQSAQKPVPATWGVIASNAMQVQLQAQGMQFLPPDENLATVDYTATVGYTHGMIRCLYERERIGHGAVYEMSIGTNTYKLASCLSCSLFMLAQGADASASHIGAGESWAPYYPQVAADDEHEAHTRSYFEDDKTLPEAITVCNARHAAHLDHWMKLGLWALFTTGADKCLASDKHKAAFAKLQEKLGYALKKDAAAPGYVAPKNDDFSTVARDFYLDAMTAHKKDALRLTSALLFGDKGTPFADGAADWSKQVEVTKDVKGIWDTWTTDIADDKVALLITPPDATLKTTYKITISKIAPEKYAWPQAKLVQKLSDKPATDVVIGENGQGTFTVLGDPKYWQLKWSTDPYLHPVKPDPSTSVYLPGAANFSYTITKA